MDKGIRQGVSRKFAEMLPTLAELGGRKFRRILLDWTVEEYKCTMAAASTHYNHAFQAAKVATPALVVGLGRPEGKNNGGRKKKPAAEVDAAALLAANMAAARSGNEGDTGSVTQGDAAVEGAEDGAPAGTKVEEPLSETPALPEAPRYTVKKADGAVVAEGLSLEDANKLVDKAAKARKGKLIAEAQA